MSRKKTYMMDRIAGCGGLSVETGFSSQVKNELKRLLHKVPEEIVGAFINDLELSCSIYKDIVTNPTPDKDRIVDELQYFKKTANQLIEHISKWHIESEESLRANYVLSYKRYPPVQDVAAELKMMVSATNSALADLKGTAGNKHSKEVFLGDHLRELFKTHLVGYYKISRSRDATFPTILSFALREVGSDKNPYDIAKATIKKELKKGGK